MGVRSEAPVVVASSRPAPQLSLAFGERETAPRPRGAAGRARGRGVRGRLLRRKGRFWSERYHRRDLRTPTETRNVLRYVLRNTQKHHRVIGDRAFADPHSSAATFDGFSRVPAVFEERYPWPRVTPRTRLLDVGWRRRGLLDPGEPPPSSPHAAQARPAPHARRRRAPRAPDA